MKTMSIGGIALCLLFFACKKNNDTTEKPVTPNNPEKVAVTFGVANFKQETGSFPFNRVAALGDSSADSLKNYINYLGYIAYDSHGAQVSGKYQRADTTSDFGTIQDSLPPGGPYTIFIYGCTDEVEIDNIQSLDQAYLSYFITGTSIRSLTKETFAKKFTININHDTIVPAIQLPRIVSKVEVNVLDALPSQNIRVYLQEESERYYLGTGKCDYPQPPGWGMITTDFTKVSTTKYERFILNNIQPFNVYISCTDGAGVTASKVVNVKCEWNKKVILTGNLFGADIDTTIGFKVSVSNDWSTDSTNIPF